MTTAVPPVVHRVLDDGCGGACVAAATVEALHRDCFCVAVDPLAVREQLNSLLNASGAPVRLTEAHAHLFSSLPIFVPEQTVAQMVATVKAVTEVVATPIYVAAALSWAPAIAARDPG